MADVNVDFDARDKGVGKTIGSLQKRFKGFEGGVAGFSSKVGNLAGSFKRLLGPLVALTAGFLGARKAMQAFTEAIRIGGELNDLASRTGATAGELMILQRAFTNSGISAEKVGPTINRLQKAIFQAGEGVATYTDAFDKLNLSHTDLMRMSPTEQLSAIAKALAAIPNPTERSALAMMLLGKSGAEVLPFLRNFNTELGRSKEQLGSAPRLMDEMNEHLDAIGDNFKSVQTKGMEFVLGALKHIAPELARITEEIAKLDFAAYGEALADQMLRVYDFSRGLFNNPMKFFGLYGNYLNSTFRAAGDSLLTAFRVAFDFAVNAMSAMMDQDVVNKLSAVLADGFVHAINVFNLKAFEMVESVLAFFGQLFASVTNMSLGDLMSKLFDLVKFFASDFGMALTNPIKFIAGKLGSALLGAAEDSAEGYMFAWDEATGGIIDRTKAGLLGAVDASGERLSGSATAFGEAMSTSMNDAVAKTDIVRSNFYGSAEAIAGLKENIRDVETIGKEIRTDSEAAAFAQSEVPSYAESMAEAYEAAGMDATHLRNEIAAAKGEAKITADIYTGPAGIAGVLSDTASATSEASNSIVTAFDNVSASGESVKQSVDMAGESFTKSASDAGLVFGQEVRAALSGITDSFRGIATETTLQQAVAELKSLVARLPQPVLI